jgi:hypothetical protein
MIKLIEELENYTANADYDFNYLLDKYEFPNYDKYRNNKSVLYHNTRIDRVDKISKNGLLCDVATAEIDSVGTIPMIWAVDVGGGSGYGGCTIAFKNNTTDYEKVNNTDVTIYEDIPPKDILFIDTWICEDVGLWRISDARRIINKVDVDRYRKTLCRKYDNGVKFFYDIDYIIERATQ